ncbi:MAG: WD40 repeat domain-containing protein, partial [Flavobacterium sp.]
AEKNELIVMEHGGYICSIDLKTKQMKQEHRFRQFGFQDDIRLQSGNKRIMVGCSGGLAVYKKETSTEKYSYNWGLNLRDGIKSFAWDELNSTVFMCYREKSGEVRKYNYETNFSEWIPLGDQSCHIMTKHPKEAIMCIADYSGNISLRNVDDTLSKIKTIVFDAEMKECQFCQYSSDGSYIVVGNSRRLIVVDPNRDIDTFLSMEAKEGDIFKSIAVHPNGSILAILLNRNISLSRNYVYNKQIVRCWDIKTQQCIGNIFEFDCDEGYDFTFSNDGLEMVVVLEKKCVRRPVLFAIKDKCLYPVFVLNGLKEIGWLNGDTVRYIDTILLELFRF